MNLHKELNKEKLDILKEKGSCLIVANPGTGKTKLLAHKYVDLIAGGVGPEEILCLTFTRKAKLEMEERIIGLIEKNDLKVDLSKLEIYTFHSYAMDYLEDEDIVSTDLLRYNIFEYVLEKEVFTQAESYLLESVVPKIENSMRYIKNYGILPSQIDEEKVNDNLEDLKKGKKVTYTKEELKIYFDHFIKIFREYEKNKIGLDYTDVLIRFKDIKSFEKYKHVLIDELQDVNNLEAEIALMSGEEFFTVGDKKQAIFGFQGGSISNFEHFKKLGEEFKLVENFRSTNEILDYAKEFYLAKNIEALKELDGLKNAFDKTGKKPVIIEDEKLGKEKLVNLTKQLLEDIDYDKGEQLGIIVRTNGQILKYSKVLEQAGIDFAATFSASSEEARKNIINFIWSVFSNDVDVVRNAFFTPFFPCDMQTGFELSKNRDLKLEEIFVVCPRFKEIRDKTRNIEDVNLLFNEYILPVCFAYGEEYVKACAKLQTASTEALNQIKNLSLQTYVNYLKAADILGGEDNRDSKVVLTTIHKSKGLQYKKVIYLPSKSRDLTSFQDAVAEAILKTHVSDYSKGEIEEEDLRSDFVAMTRAEEELYIITKKGAEYKNKYSELNDVDSKVMLEEKIEEKQKLAYNLFVNKEYEKAKELLETNKKWLGDYIKNYFEKMEKVSFSLATDSAFDFLKYKILKINDFVGTENIGLVVHKKIEEFLKGNKQEISEEEKPFFDNATKIIEELKSQGYEFDCCEYKLEMPLKNLINEETDLIFVGYIDAVYKKDDDVLLVDWKTNRTDKDGSKHRQQLALYKKAYSILEGYHEEKINIAVAYVGLRNNINDGNTNMKFNDSKPRSTAIDTITSKIKKINEWRNNPVLFIEELKTAEEESTLLRVIKEELA